MGLLAHKQTIAQQQDFALPPAQLFALFTDPQHGRALFGVKDFNILSGRPDRPGPLRIAVVYAAEKFAAHVPAASLLDELRGTLNLELSHTPHRVLSRAEMGPLRHSSDILFAPQGKGTRLGFTAKYELGLLLRPYARGIHKVVTASVHESFCALAGIANDNKAAKALQARVMPA